MLDTRWKSERLNLRNCIYRVSSIEIQHRVSLLEGNRTDDLINDGNNLQPGSVK